MYKLIACDMDETLLNDEHKIPKSNIDAIKRAVSDYGIYFVPATGRGYMQIQDILTTLGLDNQENSYVIAFNGGSITENRNNHVLQIETLDYNVAELLFNYGLQQSVCVQIFTQDKLYLYHPNEEEILKLQRQSIEYTILTETTIQRFKEIPIAKMIFQNLNQEYLSSLEKPIKKLVKGKVALSYSSDRYMELNPVGVNKGVGLSKLAQLLNIDLSETIAVGDNFNDQSMLEVAGLSIAVNNAHQEIKEISDVTTVADNNQGAIAELLETYIFSQHK